MAGIQIQNFAGLVPRITPRSLPRNAATIAAGAKLGSGSIEAYHIPTHVETRPSPIQSMMYYKGQRFTFPRPNVDLATSVVLDDLYDRVFWTTPSGVRVARFVDIMANTGHRPLDTDGFPLGVPRPTIAPVLIVIGPAVGTPESRAYVYTWTTTLGEEGPPSPAQLIDVYPGQTVQVTAAEPAPAGRNISGLYLYRAAAGVYNFVASFIEGALPYNDAVPTTSLGERLASEEWDPPPSTARNLVRHPAEFLCLASGNTVHISEKRAPHAFPAAYAKKFDHQIVKLGVFGTTIVVLTEGRNYRITGNDPSALTVDVVPEVYPCVSAQSVANADRGVVYASREGLAVVGYGAGRLLTQEAIDVDTWQRMLPKTMIGEVYGGRYYCTYILNSGNDFQTVAPVGGSFIFDYKDSAAGQVKDAILTTHPRVFLCYSTLDDQLTVSTWGNGFGAIQRWDNANTPTQYATASGVYPIQPLWSSADLDPFQWRSKEFVTPFLTDFTCAKVTARFPVRGESPGDHVLTFNVYVEGVLAFTRPVVSNTPFRLPRWHRSTGAWQFEVRGTRSVYEIHIATSMEELKQGGAMDG